MATQTPSNNRPLAQRTSACLPLAWGQTLHFLGLCLLMASRTDEVYENSAIVEAHSEHTVVAADGSQVGDPTILQF